MTPLLDLTTASRSYPLQASSHSPATSLHATPAAQPTSSLASAASSSSSSSPAATSASSSSASSASSLLPPQPAAPPTTTPTPTRETTNTQTASLAPAAHITERDTSAAPSNAVSEPSSADGRRLSHRIPFSFRKYARGLSNSAHIRSGSSSISFTSPLVPPRHHRSASARSPSASLRTRTASSSPHPPRNLASGPTEEVRNSPHGGLNRTEEEARDSTGTRQEAGFAGAENSGITDGRRQLDRPPILETGQRLQKRSGKGDDRKMHQTSSRLLRMTDDERPFTRDFKDLFSTLMVSLPLSSHRVRFNRIEHTFTAEEAITNLGSLKFSQSNRMPDPKDASRVVTTTTTTTFSMAKEMARSVCQKFLEARFIESCEGKTDFQNKSSVWQLTPKGIHILERFCSRNGIQSAHVKAVIDSDRNAGGLVILERNTETDKLHHDEQTVEIIFRRFVGHQINVADHLSDSDSVHEFAKCVRGVKMLKEKNIGGRVFHNVFTGKSTVDWLMDCCTMVDKREGLELGQLFLDLRLIAPADPHTNTARELKFNPAKQQYYYVTSHGEVVAGWVAPTDDAVSSEASAAKVRDGAVRDSNTTRTNIIIRNPSWRLLYREFLKETMCEENLSFYLEVQDFNNQYSAAIKSTDDHKVETIRETLAAAYGLYNAFLAPGSPNELNIDHALRTQLATRMTRAVGDDQAMMQSLVEVADLFEKAQTSIFKLMASDSVPKFIKHPKYGPQLKGLDAAASRSTS